MSALAILVLAQVVTATPRDVAVAGRTVRANGSDTVAVAGVRVYLHRVGEANQGVIDSQVTTADGRFSWRSRVDSGDVLLVSSRWHGVEYFAAPVSPGAPVELMVVDTSSRAPVTVAARHVIVGGPAADGSRDVVDLLVLRNSDSRTRVGPTEQVPAFAMPLPRNVANLAVGDADFAAEAFDLHVDTLALLAPIPPGDRQFFLQYQLPPGATSLDIPLDPSPDTLTVLAEEPTLEMPSWLVVQGSQQVAGRSFTRWSGRPAGDLAIGLGGRRRVPGWLIPVLLAIVAVPLLLVTRRALLPPRPG